LRKKQLGVKLLLAIQLLLVRVYKLKAAILPLKQMLMETLP